MSDTPDIDEQGRPEPFGPAVPARVPLPAAERRAKAAALMPHIRAVASADASSVGGAMIGHFTDDAVVLELLAGSSLERLASLGTSCPDHFLRTKVRPLVLDLPSDAPVDACVARLAELHAAYREDYAAYYDRHAEPGSPPMRGADPTIVLVPGVGMFSFGRDKQTARVAGEFYVNAINVMRGAEAVSTYAPIAERLVAEGACVVVADLNAENAQAVAEELGGPDKAVAVKVDVSDEDAVAAALAEGVLAFGGVDLVVNNAGLSLSKPLLETTVADWDLQHDVMAKGSFLVSREAARAMIAQDLGGDIIYISSKNSVFAGPNNIAYSAVKADQAHQVRLLAAELGGHGIRVNGINPDGVVRGSGIFAGGWGAKRAEVYGVKEEDLGAYYAKRTLLGREVLPEHVADAVFALTGGDLSQTTGLHVPVDSGVAAAFLR